MYIIIKCAVLASVFHSDEFIRSCFHCRYTLNSQVCFLYESAVFPSQLNV
jgi:hypothetical protein